MPQINSLSLSDGTQSLVYSPRQATVEKTVLVKSDVYPIGDWKVTLGMSAATTQRPTTRIDYSLECPFLNTASGFEGQLRGKALAKGYFVIPTALSNVDRSRVLASLRSLVADAILESYVKNLDPYWG